MTDPTAPPYPATTGSAGRLTLTLDRKKLHDTPAGCRALAADDRHRAEALSTEHARWRYERSAAAWTARADMLDRLEATFQKRLRRERQARSAPSRAAGHPGTVSALPHGE